MTFSVMKLHVMLFHHIFDLVSQMLMFLIFAIYKLQNFPRNARRTKIHKYCLSRTALQIPNYLCIAIGENSGCCCISIKEILVTVVYLLGRIPVAIYPLEGIVVVVIIIVMVVM